MTHIIMKDYRPTSTTSQQEVQVPVTVIETPPMVVLGVRLYQETHYGLKSMTEVWASKISADVKKRCPVPSKTKPEKRWAEIDEDKVDEVRLIVHSQPKLVSGIPKKTPEIMELHAPGHVVRMPADLRLRCVGGRIPGARQSAEGGKAGEGPEGREGGRRGQPLDRLVFPPADRLRIRPQKSGSRIQGNAQDEHVQGHEEDREPRPYVTRRAWIRQDSHLQPRRPPEARPRASPVHFR